MNDAILTLNTGSSIIKLGVYQIENSALQKDVVINGGISGLDSNPVSAHDKG